MNREKDINDFFIERKVSEEQIYVWSEKILEIFLQEEIISTKDILSHVCENIIYAKNRIYTTHNIESESDLELPELYKKALDISLCRNRFRITFGDKFLNEKFVRDEKHGFKNIYMNGQYQRMILIDNIIFYKINNSFYMSTNKQTIDEFLSYFNYYKK